MIKYKIEEFKANGQRDYSIYFMTTFDDSPQQIIVKYFNDSNLVVESIKEK